MLAYLFDPADAELAAELAAIRDSRVQPGPGDGRPGWPSSASR